MVTHFCIYRTPRSNADKHIKDQDVSLWFRGESIKNIEFRFPDENGDRSLLEAWQRECRRLNEQRPETYHWVSTDPTENT